MSFSYLMPAEWEQHSATLLAWPHNKEDWPDKFAPIPWVYTEILRHLVQVERVSLIMRNNREREQAQSVCERAGVNSAQLDFHTINTNRIWMRDSGPIIVRSNSPSSGLVMLDFRFNAWAKYANHRLDDKVPALLNEQWQLQRIQPLHKGKRVVLEGGAIDVNGQGALLATEECLLSDVQVRNPGFSREDYEEIFANYLGITQVIWLGNGIIGDDTHGHVDDITRFVTADTIVTTVEHNTRDENYSLLKNNLKRLKAARDNNGKAFTIVELPMPKPVIFEGERLPASYANFLIANKLVLVPTFNDANDRIALNIIKEVLPNHEVIGIHAVDLVWGLGTIHCMSQQIPFGVVN